MTRRKPHAGEGNAHESGKALAAFLALAAVLYLTLLPFEFRDLTPREAWSTYWAQAWTFPDPGSRQQWVANALMFVPLGFFVTLWFRSPPRARWLRALGPGICIVVGAAVTAGVEFIQAWIPNRAPSPVDMSANVTGTILGTGVATAFGERLWRLAGTIATGRHPRVIGYLLHAYVAVYAFSALFPFDFPLGTRELAERLAGDHWGWWTAPGGCEEGPARCVALGALSPLLAVPVGIWVSRLIGGHAIRTLASMVAVAVALELMQLLLYSGVAEGRAVLLRLSGMVAGGLIGRMFSLSDVDTLRARWGAPLAALLVIPYAAAVFGLITGFSDYHWDWSRAGATWRSLNLLPFYYHYFVSEAAAARSVVYQTLAYAPVGVLIWLSGYELRRTTALRLGATGWAAVLALALSAAVETLKLFAEGQRPDPTGPLIAALAAALGHRAFVLLSGTHVGSPRPRRPPTERAHELTTADATGTKGEALPGISAATNEAAHGRVAPPARGRRLIGAAIWIVTLAAAAWWPVANAWLLIGLGAYGALLYWYPAVCLLVLPAAAPLLDLSLLTGFETVDEFDLLALASIGSLLLHARPGRGVPPLPRAFAWLLAAFTLSLAVSAVIGLHRSWGTASQGVSALLSEYSVLWAMKGFAAAVVVFLLTPQAGIAAAAAVRRYLIPGMTIGLAVAVAVTFWERATYPGILDFDSSYRISGLFTDMRLGGPSVEVFLVLTLPAVACWAWLRPSFARLSGALAVVSGGVYALLVTYSRGGYGGLAVAIAVILVLLLAQTRGAGKALATTAVGAALAVGAAAGVTALGGVPAERLGRIDQDLDRRLAHWRHVLAIADDDPLTVALGHGPGTFAGHYRAHSDPQRLPANYAIRGQGRDASLLLGSGGSLYINQRLPRSTAGDALTLTVEARSTKPATLRLFVCEKHVRHSFGCSRSGLSITAATEGPRERTVGIRTQALTSSGFPPRHLTFAISNSTPGSVIAIDSIQLHDGAGRPLLRNSHFAEGARHWYFTTDDLRPWRTENQWLEVYFAQGWFGAGTFTALLLVGVASLVRRALAGDFASTTIVASVLGVLAVGIFSTVLYSPRLAFLFYLLLLTGVASAHSMADGGSTERSPRRAGGPSRASPHTGSAAAS